MRGKVVVKHVCDVHEGKHEGSTRGIGDHARREQEQEATRARSQVGIEEGGGVVAAFRCGVVVDERRSRPRVNQKGGWGEVEPPAPPPPTSLMIYLIKRVASRIHPIL